MRTVFAIEYADYDDYGLEPIFSTRASADAAFRRLEKLDPSQHRRSVVRVSVFDSVDEWLASGEAPAPISTWKGD